MNNNNNNNNKCVNCGICRNCCPVFKVLKNDVFSPRGKNILTNNNQIEKDFFYKYCNDCRACVGVCPVGVGFDVVKKRILDVDSGFETEENKEMINNIRKYGNPFGDVNKDKKDNKLYCC